MTVRTKTVEFAYPLRTTSLNANTSMTSTPAITIYLPENKPANPFKSVLLEFSVSGNETNADSITAVIMGITLGAVAVSNVTTTQTITNSGENQHFVFYRDVTAYFNTNWTGTSMTSTYSFQANSSSTNVLTIAHSVKIIITYQYEDSTSNTRIKTVRIPIDGNTGAIASTTATAIGQAGQFPALDTFLPESTKVYRDIFVETYGHTGNNGTLGLTFHNLAEVNCAYTNNLSSDRMFKRIDKLSGVTTSASGSISARVSSLSSPQFVCLSCVIIVTYEYDHGASTRIINSLMLPALEESGFMGGSAETEKSRFRDEYLIQEPGTITLIQSAVMMSYIDAGALSVLSRASPSIAATPQAYKTYAHTDLTRCGGMFHMFRIDSGSVGGIAGIATVYGYNEIIIDYYSNSATAGSRGTNASAIIYLNYTSDKHSNGDGVHNNTTIWNSLSYNATSNFAQSKQFTVEVAPTWTETSYWITNCGYQIHFMTSTTSAGNMNIVVNAEMTATEDLQGGWDAIYSATYATDTEIGPSICYGLSTPYFKQYPTDLDTTKLLITNSRLYRLDCNPAVALFQMQQLVTKHHITYTLTLNLANAPVAPSGYAWRCFIRDKIFAQGTKTYPWTTLTIDVYNGADDVYFIVEDLNTLKTASSQWGYANTITAYTADFGGGSSGPTYYSYG